MTESPASSKNTIEIRVEEIGQLFHTLDPFPFMERDLDEDAEAFIVSWAQELKPVHPIRILIHMPRSQADSPEARDLSDALHRFFNYRADMIGHDIRELFRVGRWSLLIGISVLASCILAIQLVRAVMGTSEIGRFAEEGLIILGWVANWRPIEIFLYDWWPLSRKRSLYGRLGSSEIIVAPGSEAKLT